RLGRLSGPEVRRFEESRTFCLSPCGCDLSTITEIGLQVSLWPRVSQPQRVRNLLRRPRQPVGHPKLGPEKASTFEFSVERKLAHHLEGLVTYYHYQLGDLIQGVAVENGFLQYQNGARNRADGFETELSGRPVPWFETSGSLALQSAWDFSDRASPANSPTRIIKW